jgi:diguanylate cyclase (GGDEF)-like protein
MKPTKIETVKVALSTRVLVGFMLAVVLISLLGVYLRKRALEFQQYREQVAHSRMEVDALQSYLSAVEDAETSQRGFLLTGNEKYLAPYDAAKTGITYRVNQLADLAKDDAESVKAAEQLKTLTWSKFSELAITIQKRRESGLQAALAVVNTDEGNNEMASIRKLVAEMDQKVRRRQALSEDNYNDSVYRTELSFTATLIVQMILLLILSFTVQGDLKYRAKAQAELQDHRRRLALALDNEKSLSRSDYLTGLANRRAFEESFDMECKRSRRYNRPITLVYMDLDNFKQVNDGQGHQTGDEVLVAVAASLRTNLRATDCVARLGGDEFAILLPETGEEAAQIIMRKLESVLQRLLADKNWPIGFSFGVVTFPVPLDSLEAMLQRADKLMYEAKQGGKGAMLFESV